MSQKQLSTWLLSLLIGSLAVGSFVAGRATADQPRMRNALSFLQQAKAELSAATGNKGGHRVKAIDLVNQAITQVRYGIQDGR
ncbi:hypothetical protein DO97_15780 [Neosynechococcus sphagnicola sy1]|uniref:Uncharacterized protein n=1 Tax=Neosynechococcus sphagnicola sy1 TaxID=1497020 RepID=A0A098TGM1_9CYAN|nr:hypothetical protein [Neosynechococcus sphagnicola]KGF71740.1 hypothetical protein DO97_15780 [Neosynechococcus sphagnicola sy1]